MPDNGIEPVRGSTWRHYKGGLYLVQDIVTHSETKERMVLYKPVGADPKQWVRPLAMWYDRMPDGRQRFTLAGPVAKPVKGPVKVAKPAKPTKPPMVCPPGWRPCPTCGENPVQAPFNHCDNCIPF